MTGFQQFIDTFGDITVSQVVWFIMGLGFIIFSGRKIAKYLTDRAIAKKEQDDKLKVALETVGNTIHLRIGYFFVWYSLIICYMRSHSELLLHSEHLVELDPRPN